LARRKDAFMPLEILNPVVGIAFVMVWLLAGRVLASYFAR
jgi:hypothetical protein